MILQKKYKFPGLQKELESFLLTHEIDDVCKYSKKEWKELIDRKVNSLNRDYLIASSRRYKKIDYLDMALEEYEMKEYFSTLDLQQARTKFKERASTMKFCIPHFPSSRKFLEGGFFCSCEKEEGKRRIQSLFHWKLCPEYSNLRKSRNLNLDRDLMSYYLDIIHQRAKELENHKK